MRGPVLGGLADRGDGGVRVLAWFCVPGVAWTLALFTVDPGEWLSAGVLFALAYIAYAASSIIYNALLPLVAPRAELRGSPVNSRVRRDGFGLPRPAYRSPEAGSSWENFWCDKPPIVEILEVRDGSSSLSFALERDSLAERLHRRLAMSCPFPGMDPVEYQEEVARSTVLNIRERALLT